MQKYGHTNNKKKNKAITEVLIQSPVITSWTHNKFVKENYTKLWHISFQDVDDSVVIF